MNSPWPKKVGASICQTCGDEPMLNVVGLTEMPVSAGIGGIAERAEPFNGLRLEVAACAGGGVRDQARYDNWLDKVRTYVDGEYMTLREALARHPITSEKVARQKSWQETHSRKSS